METTSTEKPPCNPSAWIEKTTKLPRKPDLPEPQNDPYWLIEGKRVKCHGCRKEIEYYALGRIECDYFPDVKFTMKRWGLGIDARYYHTTIKCIRLRRPDIILERENIRMEKGCELTTEKPPCNPSAWMRILN